MKVVIFVDVQNDFVKGGKLAFSYPEHDNVPNIIEFAKQCRAKGYMLYATADTHEATKDEIVELNPGDVIIGYRDADGKAHRVSGYAATLEGQKLPIEHCIEGTDGHKIVEGLVKDENGDVIIPQGHIIDKPTFGSFDLLARIDQDFVVDSYGKLTRQSKFDGIGEELDEIIIVGYCASICVMSNALLLRAKYPNVKITVKADLCGDVDKEAFDAAMKIFKMQQIDVENYVEPAIGMKIWKQAKSEEELDEEEAQELAAAKDRMKTTEEKLGDKGKYANVPDIKEG